MYQYRIYGMCLISDLLLPQLEHCSDEEADTLPQITVTEAPFPVQLKQNVTHYSHIAKDVSYLSNSYCYLLAEHGATLSYERKEHVSDTLLGAYILGWGISMLCHQQGRPALHGSCVAGPEGAILICGHSGSGKSTVTRELLSRGYTFLADDISVVRFEDNNTVSAHAAFPYQKLCRDAVERLQLPQEELLYIDEKKDKFLVPYKGNFPHTPVPVRALVFLSVTQGEPVSVTELSGVPKFKTCMNAFFLKPLLGPSLFSPENGVMGLTLASRIPAYNIKRPANIDCSSELVTNLLRIIH